MKPKVKVSITCPRCGEKNVKETNNYHEIIHGDYFKETDILDFEDIKEKIKSEVYAPFILSDAYHYITPFACCERDKNIKITYTQNRSWGGYDKIDVYTVEPAGNFIDPVCIERFFKYLETKGRSVIDGKKICQKEIFVNRVWNLIKHQFKDRPFMIRDDKGDRQIIYIGAVGYYLGYGEEIAFYGVTPLGKMCYIRLSKHDMQKFEYIEIPHDLCKQISAYMGEM
jgi:hypothetical protein